MKIFCNGDIICCDEKNSEYRVLIEDKGKIIYLGNEILEAYAQVKSEDLSGACLVPAACNHPNPNERISALDALKMHTSWGAKMSFDEDERGTLAKGKIADFVVLDKNPLRVPLESIKDIEIEALYLGGRKYTGQGKSTAKLLARCAGEKIRSLIN